MRTHAPLIPRPAHARRVSCGSVPDFGDTDSSSPRRNNQALAARILRIVWVLVAMAAVGSNAAAQDLTEAFDDETETVELNSESFASPASATGLVDWRSRLGHLAMETFGRQESITHFEVMPIVPLDVGVLFSDFRVFVDNNGELGGNVGMGYRVEVGEMQRVLGLSAWYDIDETSGESVQQAAVGVELLGEYVDFLFNGYFPVGDDDGSRVLLNTARFSGNGVLVDQTRELFEAMPGLDVGVGVRLPGNTAIEHDIRVLAGFYHFHGDDVPDIDGYRLRLSGLITDNISAEVEYTDDDTFGSNLIVGGSILLPGSFRSGNSSSSGSDHLRRFAQRNYNVIVSRKQAVTSGIVAMNAATGSAFSVQHVSSSGSAGATGSDTDPHSTVAAAQAAGAGILFLHAGTVLTEAVTLSSGESLLGEGVSHLIDVDGIGTIPLPTATSGTSIPILQSVTGNALTLASNTRVSGLTIDSPTGHGVMASGISDFEIDQVSVRLAGADGLFLSGITGPVSLTSLDLGDATGASLHIDGSTADITVAGTIANTMGRSLLIENTTDDSTIDLMGATITDTGAGVRIADVDGDVLLTGVTVTNSTGTGIEVNGGNGNVTFNGVTTVAADTGIAIDVQDRVDDAAIDGTQGQTNFENVAVTTDGQTGLFVRNSVGVAIAAGDITTTNSGVIADIADSATDIRLQSVSADGAPVALSIVDSTGVFGVAGITGVGSGGLIENSTTAVQLDNAGLVSLINMDFDANQTVLTDSGSEQIFLGGVRITNTTGGTPAIALADTRTFELFGALAEDNMGPLIDATFSTSNSYGYTINSNTIVSDVGDVINITNAAGAIGSTMAFTATDNVITLNQAATDFVDVTWDGPLTVNVSQNTVTGTGGSNFAARVTNTGATSLTTLGVQQNIFNFTGGNDVGVMATLAGTSNIGIISNTFDFDGSDGIGMRFDLMEASTVSITSNLLTDDGSAATAVLFDMIADQSSVAIDNNRFDFNTTSTSTDRGIIFTAVEALGTISLSGSINNVITGATTPFSIPGGTSTGGVPVNGVFEP